MDIKQCPKCGKDIPKEANFCPYCMTKLIAENGVEISFESKNKRKRSYIIILLLVTIIIIEIATIVFIINDNNQFKGQEKPEDYTQYLGVWIDEENIDTESITTTGGRKIEICKVIGNNIVFNIESYREHSLTNEKACIEYVKVELIDGKATFNFTDDGYGNSGSGEIKLSDREIYAKVRLNNSGVGGSWDLSMDTNFVQTEKYTIGQEIDIQYCKNLFDSHKVKFGNRTDVAKYGDTISYDYDNGLTVEVEDLLGIGDLYIRQIWIDYDNLHSDYIYGYKGINNESTVEDVLNMMHRENIEEDTILSEESFYYRGDDEVVYIYFEDGFVDSINYMILY